ncbi:MAG: division/cell wall cluster transcriptional repressor MraZ [Pseudomonadota bacterium]
MDRFVSTFENKIDAKGRISVPAPFRAILERDGYKESAALGIYCYPSIDAPALDAGGERLAQKIDRLLGGLADYSDERDELSLALYGDVKVLAVDGDGRIVLPPDLREHAGLDTKATFVGMGDKFQIWAPERFEERRAEARAKVQDHRRLFAQQQTQNVAAAHPEAGRRSSDESGEGGARE